MQAAVTLCAFLLLIKVALGLPQSYRGEEDNTEDHNADDNGNMNNEETVRGLSCKVPEFPHNVYKIEASGSPVSGPSVPHGLVVIVGCSPGYGLNSDDSTIYSCEQGDWSGLIPQCHKRKKSEDFEIRKKGNGVQKKRQYSSNKDDSSSDSDHGKSKKERSRRSVSRQLSRNRRDMDSSRPRRQDSRRRSSSRGKARGLSCKIPDFPHNVYKMEASGKPVSRPTVPHGLVVTVGCSPGYGLNSDDSTIFYCEQGDWSGQIPQCHRKEDNTEDDNEDDNGNIYHEETVRGLSCKLPDFPHNVYTIEASGSPVSRPSVPHGLVVTVGCSPDYGLNSDDSTIFYCKQGDWSGLIPQCHREEDNTEDDNEDDNGNKNNEETLSELSVLLWSCEIPEFPHNVYKIEDSGRPVSGRLVPDGFVMNVGCSPGYHQNATDSTIFYCEDGNWDELIPQCYREEDNTEDHNEDDNGNMNNEETVSGLSCKIPEFPHNVYKIADSGKPVSGPSVPHGILVNVGCSPGYRMNSTDSTIYLYFCVYGNWDQLIPQCYREEDNTEDHNADDNGNMNNEETVSGLSCKIPDFPHVVFEIRGSGRPLSGPSVPDGIVVNVGCSPGYRLNSTDSTIFYCEHGNWDHLIPQCHREENNTEDDNGNINAEETVRKAKCKAPSNPYNRYCGARVSGHKMTIGLCYAVTLGFPFDHGENMVVYCAAGSRMRDNSTIVKSVCLDGNLTPDFSCYRYVLEDLLDDIFSGDEAVTGSSAFHLDPLFKLTNYDEAISNGEQVSYKITTEKNPLRIQIEQLNKTGKTSCNLPSNPYNVYCFYNFDQDKEQFVPTSCFSKLSTVAEKYLTFSHGQTTYVTCAPGSRLRDARPIATMECFEGKWIPEISCSRNWDLPSTTESPVSTERTTLFPQTTEASGLSCKIPEFPHNLYKIVGSGSPVSGPSVPHGLLVRVGCSPGYRLHSTSSTIYICEQGNWSGLIPQCHKETSTTESPVSRERPTLPQTTETSGLSCRIPDSPHNLYQILDRGGPRPMVGQSVPDGYFITVGCSYGHRLHSTGSTIYACNRGRWSGTIPKCHKTCYELKSMTMDLTCRHGNTPVSCVGTQLPNTTLDYECKPNHSPHFPSIKRKLRCLEDGIWTDNLPFCVPHCGISDLKSASQTAAIVGGSEAQATNFPWHAGIYQLEEDGWKYACGGSLISERLVLTAAHCVTKSCPRCTAIVMNVSDVLVALGKTRQNLIDREESQLNITVLHIYVQTNYRGTGADYAKDISVISLASRVEVTKFIMPVCFQHADYNTMRSRYREVLSGSVTGYVPGWGRTEACSTCSGSDSLMYVNTTVKNYQDCGNIIQDSDPTATILLRITPDKLCSGDGSVSVVQKGDSGGGLVFPFNGKFYILGVVSTFVSLQDVKLGAYTNLEFYYQWINEILEMW